MKQKSLWVKNSCLCLYLCFVVSSLSAQLNTPFNLYDSNFYAPAKRPALKNFLYHLSLFPPLPTDKYEIGIQTGIQTVYGDVTPTVTPLSIGVSVRKALGYTFSLRGQYSFGISKGQNATLSTVQQSDSVYNLYFNQRQNVIKNYQTISHHISIQALINLTNINFASLEKKYNVYALLGVGYLFYDTKVDAYKGTELYPFVNGFNDFDGSYETNFNSTNKNTLTGSIGLGVQYRLADNFSLQLESQWAFTNTNQIDASRDQNGSRSFFENNIVNTISFGINYHIGKRKSTAPLYWLNPLNYLYKEINSPRAVKLPQPKLNDTDGDGVADLLDREEATAPGVPVDAKGVTLDTDGDGVPDFRDAELITPSSCLPANEAGYGNCPNNKNKAGNTNNCCAEVLEQLKKMKITSKIETNKTTPADPEIQSPSTTEPIVNTNENIITMDPFCYAANLTNSLSEKILFLYNTAKLTDESVNVLNNIVEIAKRNTNISLLVQGKYYPFDNIDSVEYLYKERRDALINYLYANGIVENKIKIKNFEDYNPSNTFFELENNASNGASISTCNFSSKSQCPSSTNDFKADARYMKAYRSLAQINSSLSFKPASIVLKNFNENILNELITLLTNNTDYTLLISAPFETKAYAKDLTNETKFSAERGQVLRDAILSKYNKPNQVINLPINSSQPLGTVPTLRIVANKNIDSDGDCVADLMDKCPLVKGYKEYEGCLTSPSLSDSFALIAKNILFDFDKDVIKPSSFTYLNVLAQVILAKKYFVTIAGKTDQIGEYNHNLNLSYARAISVKKYLINKNVPEKYLQAVGLGEQEAITGTEEENSFNRRVDFWINGIDK